jgi:tetratricopeptide (TPR) repeat protein
VEHRGYHSLWWLEYGYLQQGRLREARRLLDIVAADAAKSSVQIVQSHLAQMRAHWAIETGQASPVRKPAGPHLDPAGAASDLFADAYLAIRARNRAEAERLLGELRTLRPMNGETHTDRHAHHAPHVQAIGVMEKQLEGLLLLDAGSAAQAVDRLKEAAEIEDRIPYEFGPPVPPKPAHELFGEILLTLGYAPQAQAQFQLALERSPKRAFSLLGLARAAAKAGDEQASKQAYADLRRIRQRAD